MSLESEIMTTMPNWKSFEELEESLSLAELLLLVKKISETKNEERKFAAALKGIDIDKEGESDFDRIKRQAEAKLAGKSESEYALGQLGFSVTEE